LKKISRRCGNPRILLFGTNKDIPACGEITRLCNGIHLEIRAGQTDLKNLWTELSGVDCVVSNDSGGAHLANSMGIPTVVLFGPTSSDRTAPIFDAPRKLLRSSNGEMEGFVPDEVAEEMARWWEETS
jgi:ADP-heptose:LPS heptosyltransferase